MRTVAERILSEAKKLPEGALISARKFLHLGSRTTVDHALKQSYAGDWVTRSIRRRGEPAFQ